VSVPEAQALGLSFVGDMYGVQLDQLATVLGATTRRTAAITTRWREQGWAESAGLGPGPRWVWLTRAGLRVCGLPYAATVPGLAQLAHLRAVTAVRLALESTTQYADGHGFWRSERALRARIGGRLRLREHLPDAEVHWPDGTPVPWAGECWAVEAELTAKTGSRTVAIMRELLARTGDYGCPAADVRVPGEPPRHARVVYLCSPAAQRVVARARDVLGNAGARVEIRPLPARAALPAAVHRQPADIGARSVRAP
jgi:hypothetical protein